MVLFYFASNPLWSPSVWANPITATMLARGAGDGGDHRGRSRRWQQRSVVLVGRSSGNDGSAHEHAWIRRGWLRRCSRTHWGWQQHSWVHPTMVTDLQQRLRQHSPTDLVGIITRFLSSSRDSMRGNCDYFFYFLWMVLMHKDNSS